MYVYVRICMYMFVADVFSHTKYTSTSIYNEKNTRVIVKRWTTSLASYIVKWSRYAFRRGKINIFDVRAYEEFIRF